MNSFIILHPPRRGHWNSYNIKQLQTYEKAVNKDNYNLVFEEINEMLRYFDNDIYEFSNKMNNS